MEVTNRKNTEYRMNDLKKIQLEPDTHIIASDGIELEINAAILKRCDYFEQMLSFNKSDTLYVDEPADVFRFVLCEFENVLVPSLLPDDLDFLRRLLLVFDKYLIYSKSTWEKVNFLISELDDMRPWLSMYIYFNNGIDLFSIMYSDVVPPQVNSLDVQDEGGDTLLIKCANHGDFELVKCLLEAGANDRIRNRRGYTALSYIATWRDLSAAAEMIQLLLKDNDEYVNEIRQNRSESFHQNDCALILFFAAKFGNLELVKLLATPENIHNHIVFDKKLVRYYSVGGGECVMGEHALSLASQYDHVDILLYLLSMGIDVHINNEELLHGAIKYHNLELVKTLISLGADMHADDCECQNALDVAAEYGRLCILQYFVSIGADIHVKDDCALRWAAGRNHLDVVQYLVSLGADIHADNDEAIIWAFENGHKKIVDYFNSFGDTGFTLDSDDEVRESDEESDEESDDSNEDSYSTDE